eukprot:TRINITY_DN31069_c0_g1_i1.p1 TRINITY_DN31069_c0_g1~~TRINITY_DN31069_c0_g1_i1.p1  ORF type:complete len:645 (-),score=108.23 TRINITY_DN31069_c0_g1_i1:67-2001(-)
MHHKAKAKKPMLGRSIAADNRKQKKAMYEKLHAKDDPRADQDEEDVNEITLVENLLSDNPDLMMANPTVFNPNTTIFVDTRAKPKTDPGDIQQWLELSKKLPIPKRPVWSTKMSHQQVQENEQNEFILWRKTMAAREQSENVVLTPFEKNLNVWRQLWRVVEKSELVCIILDARNPLVFRSHDLEQYILQHHEYEARSRGKTKPALPKKLLLVLNKADFLTKKQRTAWAKYLKHEGVNFVFYSAHNAEMKQQEQIKEMQRAAVEAGESPVGISSGKVPFAAEPVTSTKDSHIYTREELLHYFQSHIVGRKDPPTEGDLESPLPDESEPGIIIGMVGYPNVGKSSTINTLLGQKKVTVSATPGKTKHLQTLKVGGGITVCDCPGLVFPSFANTLEGMVLDGVLPVDSLRDCTATVQLLVQRIPKPVLEMYYGVDIEWENDQDASPHEADLLLNLVGRRKGYMTDHNKPNKSRTGVAILKDYINGHLLYIHPPPPIEGEEEEEGSEGWETDEDEGEGEDEEVDVENMDFKPVEEQGPSMYDGFNANNNGLEDLYNRVLQKKEETKKRRKKKRNPQLEESNEAPIVEIDEATGTGVLYLDPDDEVVAVRPVAGERKMTKRQERMERKRMMKGDGRGLALVRGYQAVT